MVKKENLITSGKLRQYRKNCQLSQQQVAQALGIDRSTYSYYELGRFEPDLLTIVKLAQLFRVDVSALLPTENPNNTLGESEENTSPIYSLTKDEQRLLLSYRLLSSGDKSDFLAKITNKANEQ